MPVHAAAAFGRLGMAEWLIANGAKIDAPSYNGKTPMALAIDGGHDDVAELLRQHGGKDQS
jgi:ankyrin repeat protein